MCPYSVLSPGLASREASGRGWREKSDVGVGLPLPACRLICGSESWGGSLLQDGAESWVLPCLSRLPCVLSTPL